MTMEQLNLPFTDVSQPKSKPTPKVTVLNGCWSALATRLSQDLWECEACGKRFPSVADYVRHLELEDV